MLSCSSDTDILARTIYGEARGEFIKPPIGIWPSVDSAYVQGLVAVGNVVCNRLNRRSWYGRTISEVCLKPFQFSCWNANDPNRDIITRVTHSTPLFMLCSELATALIENCAQDWTHGADHYYASSLRTPPLWARHAQETVHIGRHRFF